MTNKLVSKIEVLKGKDQSSPIIPRSGVKVSKQGKPQDEQKPLQPHTQRDSERWDKVRESKLTKTAKKETPKRHAGTTQGGTTKVRRKTKRKKYQIKKKTKTGTPEQGAVQESSKYFNFSPPEGL